MSFEDRAAAQAKTTRNTTTGGVTAAQEAAYLDGLRRECLDIAVTIIRSKLGQEPGEVYVGSTTERVEGSGYYEGPTPIYDVYTCFFCIEQHVYQIHVYHRQGELFGPDASWTADRGHIEIKIHVSGQVEWRSAGSPEEVGQAILRETESNDKPVVHTWHVPAGAISKRFPSFDFTPFAVTTQAASSPQPTTDTPAPTSITWSAGATPADRRADAKATQLLEQVRTWHTQHGWPPPTETTVDHNMDRIVIGWQHAGVSFYGRWIARNDRLGIFVVVPAAQHDLVGVRYADIDQQPCADITAIQPGARLWDYVSDCLA